MVEHSVALGCSARDGGRREIVLYMFLLPRGRKLVEGQMLGKSYVGRSLSHKCPWHPWAP